MRISVVIPSYKRAGILHDTVLSMLAQSLAATEIILSVTTLDHIDPRTLALETVRAVVTTPGLPRQRNAGVSEVARDAQLVAFFDDDVELAADYLQRCAAAFDKFTNLVLLTGWVLEDGIRKGGVSREQSRAVLARQPERSSVVSDVKPLDSAYGCNMVVRRPALDGIAFDERLPLYGWLEDLDFSFWCGRLGLVARTPDARVVHLGVSSGRVSGRRYGFSQVVNPFYLNRKGSLPSRLKMLLVFWARPVLMNLLLSLLPQRYIDRRGRLVGNLIGLLQLARGQVMPEYILEIH